MPTALLETPTTEEQLSERAEKLAGDVEKQLLPPDVGADDYLVAIEKAAPDADPARDQRVDRREEFFETLRAAATSIARSRAWRAHDLTTELLLLIEQLRDVIAADPDATDSEWRTREALQRMVVVLRSMVRRLRHDAIDRPEHAARFVARGLADVEVSEVAALLDTTPRMVNNYRKGEVGQIRKNPNRITLIGQLVYELQYSMTPRGVLLWFDAPMPRLGERTPRQLIDEDPVWHRPALIALARGGRAQTDQGGATYGALERPA